MVRVLVPGDRQRVMEVTCKGCKAKLEIAEREWRDGGYGSERYVSCPGCGSRVIKPGTEYTGDF